jgi:hypothetical protein
VSDNDNGAALSYAHQLANHLHRRHYPEVQGWEPAKDLLGLLDQIDNMTAGLVRQPQAKLTYAQIAEVWDHRNRTQLTIAQHDFAERLQRRLGIGVGLAAQQEGG